MAGEVQSSGRMLPRLGRAVCWLGVWLAAAGFALPAQAQQSRPQVGVAFGGGSARGIAHVGIIRWFEEHHIPIDVSAGTSMGGLIGGAFASGMSADELRALIEYTDWDVMFGSSSFPFKNIRRKEDARNYPSRLEFGLRGGLVPPTSLNDGQQVDLLLARIAGAYYELQQFDDLPTPFRTVAVDLKTGERVVMDRGSLASAMRATMSLPGVFPPVETDDRVLVDGGALDNIPADVVRNMGAQTVIAVDVGYGAKQEVDYSMLALMNQTIDSMMRANTRRALQSADLIIAVDVEGFGSLDWRRSAELMERGYQAAEKHRDRLLPLALPDAEWQAWLDARKSKRKTAIPVPQSISTAGVAAADVAIVRRTLIRHMNQPLDIPALEHDLASLSGLDRYQGVAWQIIGPAGQETLLVSARPKPYAPPFMMLGVNLENTTSNSFSAQLSGRYLAFDVLGSGAELRVDAAIGSNPHAGFSWYRPLFKTRVFTRLSGLVERNTLDFIAEGRSLAEYRLTRQLAGGALGLNMSRVSELTAGVFAGRVDASVTAGDPGLPEIGGLETQLVIRFLHDGHDSPVIPSGGTRAGATLTHYLKSPSVEGIERTNEGVTQLEGGAATFWKWKRRNRVFVAANGGTSFGEQPISQFSLGYAFRLDAFRVGERRGDHYGVLTVGALRQFGRLPDFMGGPIFIGGWLENGAAFNTDEDADFNTHLAFGFVVDTLVGPMALGASAGLDGGWRTFISIGRLFR
jgi:NTE family protein